jgi:hypothetical protein
MGDDKLHPRCFLHKRYKGVGLPKERLCVCCWDVYFHRKGKEPVTGEEIAGMLLAIRLGLGERPTEAQILATIVSKLTFEPDW